MDGKTRLFFPLVTLSADRTKKRASTTYQEAECLIKSMKAPSICHKKLSEAQFSQEQRITLPCQIETPGVLLGLVVAYP